MDEDAAHTAELQSAAVRLLSQTSCATEEQQSNIGACLASAKVNVVATLYRETLEKAVYIHARTTLINSIHEVDYGQKNSPAFLHAGCSRAAWPWSNYDVSSRSLYVIVRPSVCLSVCRL